MAQIHELTEDEIVAHLDEIRRSKKAKIESERPAVTEVLLTGGGQWIVWGPENLRKEPDPERRKGHYHTVHAIKFDDGSIWDVANGWRG